MYIKKIKIKENIINEYNANQNLNNIIKNKILTLMAEYNGRLNKI
jgi:hypothetical protein